MEMTTAQPLSKWMADVSIKYYDYDGYNIDDIMLSLIEYNLFSYYSFKIHDMLQVSKPSVSNQIQ